MVKTHNRECLKLFNELIRSGICREQARGVLPQNLYTKYYGTVNLHNLLKFIQLRSHEGAQWEIQQVAEACLEIAEDFFPHSVRSFIQKKMEK
jgi:thymidylate synthase (FAD)